MVLSLLYVFIDDKNPNFLSYLVSFLLTSRTRELFLPHPVLINSLPIKVEFLATFSLPTSLTHRQHSQNCLGSNLFFVLLIFGLPLLYSFFGQLTSLQLTTFTSLPSSVYCLPYPHPPELTVPALYNHFSLLLLLFPFSSSAVPPLTLTVLLLSDNSLLGSRR